MSQQQYLKDKPTGVAPQLHVLSLLDSLKHEGDTLFH